MVSFEHSPIPAIPYRPDGPFARVDVVELADLRESQRDRPGFWAPQRPRFDLLIHVERGSLAHMVDFVTLPLGPGSMLWVHAGQVQRWGDLDGVAGTALLFLPEVLTPAAVDALHASGAWHAQRFPAEAVPPAARDLFALCRRAGGSVSPLARERILESLLLSLAGAEPDADHPTRRPLYARFLRLLDAQGSVHRSVAAFARELGCTPKTLTLAVRERTGRTAKQVIDARLALEAKRILAFRPAMPVHEVGEVLGFDDAANFSKFFRRHEGVAPGAWRDALR